MCPHLQNSVSQMTAGIVEALCSVMVSLQHCVGMPLCWHATCFDIVPLHLILYIVDIVLAAVKGEKNVSCSSMNGKIE